MENIPTTGDRILRGKGLEEGRPEGGDVGDDNEDNSGGGGYGPEKRQQKMMQKWLQRSVQPEARVREQGTMRSPVVGGQERSQPQTTGYDQS